MYNLREEKEAATLMRQIQTDNITFGNLSDFFWFVTTLFEAQKRNFSVDLRFDTENGLDEVTGVLDSIIIDYPDKNATLTNLKFDFITDSNEKKHYDFTFPANRVEENKLSVPGDFMKYYIRDEENKLLVGWLVRYKK